MSPFGGTVVATVFDPCSPPRNEVAAPAVPPADRTSRLKADAPIRQQNRHDDSLFIVRSSPARLHSAPTKLIRLRWPKGLPGRPQPSRVRSAVGHGALPGHVLGEPDRR